MSCHSLFERFGCYTLGEKRGVRDVLLASPNIEAVLQYLVDKKVRPHVTWNFAELVSDSLFYSMTINSGASCVPLYELVHSLKSKDQSFYFSFWSHQRQLPALVLGQENSFLPKVLAALRGLNNDALNSRLLAILEGKYSTDFLHGCPFDKSVESHTRGDA